jgi:hypothetical protein
MRDLDDLVARLQGIEEELRDLAYERLRDASAHDDTNAAADEKRLLQARRAVARAITALGGRDDLDPTLEG